MIEGNRRKVYRRDASFLKFPIFDECVGGMENICVKGVGEGRET